MGYRRPSCGAGGLFGELWKGKVKAVRITSREGGKKKHVKGQRMVLGKGR